MLRLMTGTKDVYILFELVVSWRFGLCSDGYGDNYGSIEY
jgi:hypothetical protein